ncbi:MAG: HAD family hydrolase [Pyrinomonadaceae bacterium]|nr:HAD family hydrolase [Pyrinomonadaceae bacterium]
MSMEGSQKAAALNKESSAIISEHLHPALRDKRAVLFDAGGTLVHPDWQRLALVAEEVSGRRFTSAELRQALYKEFQVVDQFLRNKQAAPEYTRQRGWTFARMYEALGIEVGAAGRLSDRVDALHSERHLWCELDPDAPRVLVELKQAGLKVAVISNTEDGRLEELLEMVEIKMHFDTLIDSFIVGHRKPDAAIFHLALERFKLAPHEAVYVGDSYGHDVLGAEAAGLQAILLDPLDLYPQSEVPRIRALSELLTDVKR